MEAMIKDSELYKLSIWSNKDSELIKLNTYNLETINSFTKPPAKPVRIGKA